MQVSPYNGNSAARLAPFLSLGLGLSFFVVLCVMLALLRRSVERYGWPWRWAAAVLILLLEAAITCQIQRGTMLLHMPCCRSRPLTCPPFVCALEHSRVHPANTAMAPSPEQASCLMVPMLCCSRRSDPALVVPAGQDGQPSAPPMPRGIEAQVVAAFPSAPYKEAAPPTGQSCGPVVAAACHTCCQAPLQLPCLSCMTGCGKILLSCHAVLRCLLCCAVAVAVCAHTNRNRAGSSVVCVLRLLHTLTG